MRLGNTNVVKMSDLTVQLRDYELDLILFNQVFHVVKLPSEAEKSVGLSAMKTVYTAKTKREIQAWIHGLNAVWNMPYDSIHVGTFGAMISPQVKDETNA
jgi:hypothetical protein